MARTPPPWQEPPLAKRRAARPRREANRDFPLWPELGRIVARTPPLVKGPISLQMGGVLATIWSVFLNGDTFSERKYFFCDFGWAGNFLNQKTF